MAAGFWVVLEKNNENTELEDEDKVQNLMKQLF